MTLSFEISLHYEKYDRSAGWVVIANHMRDLPAIPQRGGEQIFEHQAERNSMPWEIFARRFTTPYFSWFLEHIDNAAASRFLSP